MASAAIDSPRRAARGHISRRSRSSTPTSSRSALADGDELPGRARAAPGRGRRRSRLQASSTLLHPERAGARAGGRRSATPDELDAERLRVAAALAAKRAAGFDATSIAWAAARAAGRRRRSAPRRSSRARSSPPTASTATARATPTTRRRRRSSAWCSPSPRPTTLAAARPRARAGRRRGREPRPRAPEPARQRRSPRRPWPTRADGDRGRARGGRRSRSSAARRSPPRAWAAWSRSRRAARAEPRLIALRYAGGGSGRGIGLVGKAVTFDSGGISIKPSAGMHEMKMDMSGGAAVLEAIAAIAELGPRARRRRRGPGDREHAQRHARSSPATSSPSSTARRSRSTTPTPRAG